MNRQGNSTRLLYDDCEYKVKLNQSTLPGTYQMYEDKYESPERCVYDKMYKKYDLVDYESELKGLGRVGSNCPENKYNPRCKRSSACISTYDKSVPVTYAPEMCPIVFNNIKKPTSSGLTPM